MVGRLPSARLVRCHAEAQATRRTTGNSKPATLFVQPRAAISSAYSLWQLPCLSLAQSDLRDAQTYAPRNEISGAKNHETSSLYGPRHGLDAASRHAVKCLD